MPHKEIASFDMRSTVRGALPRIPYGSIAKDILGTQYELSLVICGDALAKRMNITYRHKGYRPNVLSFPLDQKSGEIFLNVRKAEREAKEEGVSLRERAMFLYIHGCLHLAGHDHGDEMDALEERAMSKFR